MKILSVGSILLSITLWLGLSTRVVGAITALLISTVTKCALLLGRLLEQKGSVAVWTGFRNRFVPVNSVAIRISRATIKHFAPLRLLDDKFAFAPGPSTVNAGRFLLNVFALRIV